MANFSVQTDRKKCQGYGACAKAAPDVFVLDAENLVEFKGQGNLSDDMLLLAARRCPYKAIIVIDAATRQQIHPRLRPGERDSRPKPGDRHGAR